MSNKWTSPLALVLVLLFTSAADGVMDVLGPLGFLAVGAAVWGAVWRLNEIGLGDTAEAAS